MEQKTLKEGVNGVYNIDNEEEEAQAGVDIWKYVFGFSEMAVIKCAIELGVAEMLEKNGGSMSVSDLSTSLQCPQPSLHRIMRFLAHRKIFKTYETSQGTLCYSLTPLSRRVLSMASFILLESSAVMLAPWLSLSQRVRDNKSSNNAPFEAVHGENVWSYAANNLNHSKLINDAMACDARVVVPQIIKECPRLFDGVGSLVDVGGGDGTTMSMFVKAFPSIIRGINFDLPHVVSNNAPPNSDRMEHVGGDMFVKIPKADAAFLMWVLHDWGDEECVQILSKCKEAISEERGKVIIAEAVIEEDSKDKLQDVRLMLDMVMMAHTTNGKERTLKEWSYLLNKAGFNRFTVKPIQAVQSIIEAYP